MASGAQILRREHVGSHVVNRRCGIRRAANGHETLDVSQELHAIARDGVRHVQRIIDGFEVRGLERPGILDEAHSHGRRTKRGGVHKIGNEVGHVAKCVAVLLHA